MKREVTYEQFITDLKQQDEEMRELLTVSETVASIIAKLTKERISQGLSQRDLAERTGYKQPAIARIETLRVIPKIDTLAKIAYHLNLNLGFFDDHKREYIIIKSSSITEEPIGHLVNLEDACDNTSIQTIYEYDPLSYAH